MTPTSSSPARRRLAVVAVALAATLGLSGCGVSTITDLLQGKEDVFSIQPGDCFNDDMGAQDEITSVVKPDCAEPHDNEAYMVYDLGESAFPEWDEDAIVYDAEDTCLTHFERFVGAMVEETELYFAYFYPSASSWSQGDREVMCFAYDPYAQVTGTLRDRGPEFPYEG